MSETASETTTRAQEIFGRLARFGRELGINLVYRITHFEDSQVTREMVEQAYDSLITRKEPQHAN